MTFIDISWPLTPQTTGYKNRQSVSIIHEKTMERDRVRQTKIMLDAHAGTHLDMPAHFLQHGSFSQHFDISLCNGHCQVLDATMVSNEITEQWLATQTITSSRVLFKTRNSMHNACDPFDPRFVYISTSAARYLVNHNVTLVGIDYLGIERDQTGHPTHTILLEHNVVILEGLRLASVTSGMYELLCLPLSVHGIEAIPARAVLRPIQ